MRLPASWGAPLLLATLLGGCGEDGEDRPSPTDGDADADADADADGDGDGDTDADSDGDADPLGCGTHDDCVIAIRVDECCPCPVAVAAAYEAGEACLVAWPAAAEPPAECAVDFECGVCNECPAPESAVCEPVEGRCMLRFPGSCVTREDCAPTEICLVSNGQSSCVEDTSICEQDTDCDDYSWCAAGADGVRHCRELEPGQCGGDRNCADGERCKGATPEQAGQCVPA